VSRSAPRRRHSSSAWSARRTTWNGWATWTASGGIVSNTDLYDADRSSVAHAIPARHASGGAVSQAHEAGRVVDQRPPEHGDGVHHGVPVRARVISDLGDRATVAADLQRRPPRHAGCQLTACRRDPRILRCPRPVAGRAAPALLAPHQTGWSAEHRQIDQHLLPDTVTMRRPRTARRPLDVDGDHDAQPPRPLTNTDYGNVGQADQRRAHARTIRFQAGAPRDSRRQTSLRIAESLRHVRDPYATINPPSDPKRPCGALVPAGI